ncbi:hypothetical protein RRG08_037612 [Elysia crispata]|uniref:Uncharacterized protein n=1 Tax=Elysia crispata TaxID=231223 RepID=A0AAE0YH38_9GAST|nr:hypothetical protein RRG08_037612 [Elysia crispata]
MPENKQKNRNSSSYKILRNWLYHDIPDIPAMLIRSVMLVISGSACLVYSGSCRVRPHTLLISGDVSLTSDDSSSQPVMVAEDPAYTSRASRSRAHQRTRPKKDIIERSEPVKASKGHLKKKKIEIKNSTVEAIGKISILYSTLVVTAKPRKRCLAQAWNQAASVPDTQCSPLKNKWSVMSGGHQEPCPGCIHRIAVYRLAERTVEWLAGRPVGVSGAKVK